MWWLGAGLRNLTAGIWKSFNNIICCQDWEMLPSPLPQQSPISIWGSGVPEMLILLPFPDLVTILLESLAFDCSFSHSE